MKINIVPGIFSIREVAHEEVGCCNNIFATVYEENVCSVIERIDGEEAFAGSAESVPKWKCLQIDGVLSFSLSGVLVKVLEPLAKTQVSILVISSFKTDYIFVRTDNFQESIDALGMAGFDIPILEVF